jgi:hypothetical protein
LGTESGRKEKQMNEEKITIVIPNFNGMRYLPNCIEALRRDDSAPFALCIVDNGSTDGSGEWIRANCPEAQLIAVPENEGFCKAVNRGIRGAKTPYVILLNNDTRVQPGFAYGLLAALEGEPKAFSVSARMVDMTHPQFLDGAGDLYCALGWAFALGKGKTAKDHYLTKQEVFSACGGAAIYRKDVLEAIGGFDELHFAYLEDCDLGYRAQLYGYRNFYTPDAVVYHAGSGFSGSRYNEFKVSLSSCNSIYLIYKNMPLVQILLNLPLLFLGFAVKTLFFVKKGLGGVYIRGLWRGLGRCFSREGRARKQKFSAKRFPCYLRIQHKLWVNTWRRFREI